MAQFRFPNEPDEYRRVRDELLEMEIALRAQVDAVAARRRELPLGGKLAKDYRFERMGENDEVESVPFEDLFGNHNSLILYSMMFGSEWDAPCPSCTSIVDAMNANYYPTSQQCAMAVVGAASARQFSVLAGLRNWDIPVYSEGNSGYLIDYFPYRESDDPSLVSVMNVFRRTDEGIFHFWGSELVIHPKENGHPNHVDIIWPFWNLLDMTPEGRGDTSIPPQNYDHVYFTENVFPGK